MKIYEDVVKDTKDREKIIAEKTKNRLPFHGVILHLGGTVQDGVILKTVKSENDKITVEGEAKTKEDAENYFTAIKEKNDIFLKVPKSLKIENKDVVKFSFSIDL